MRTYDRVQRGGHEGMHAAVQRFDHLHHRPAAGHMQPPVSRGQQFGILAPGRHHFHFDRPDSLDGRTRPRRPSTSPSRSWTRPETSCSSPPWAACSRRSRSTGRQRVDYVELDPAMSAVQFSYGLLRADPGPRGRQRGRPPVARPHRPDLRRDHRQPAGAGDVSDQPLLHGSLLRAGQEPPGPGRHPLLRHGRVRQLPGRARSAGSSRSSAPRWRGTSRTCCCCPARTRSSSAATSRSTPTSRPGCGRRGIAADYISGYYDGDVTPERIEQLNEPAHRGRARQPRTSRRG